MARTDQAAPREPADVMVPPVFPAPFALASVRVGQAGAPPNPQAAAAA